MIPIRISAKDIAELLYGSGDLSSDRLQMIRAQEGIEVHQYWQSKYLLGDEAEVYVKASLTYKEFELEVTGRIDGIIRVQEELILEEIKSTHRDLDSVDETTTPAHFVQAKLYGYLYCLEKAMKKLKVRLTYVNVLTKKSIFVEKEFTFKALETFFMKTIDQYTNWIRIVKSHEANRAKSIVGLTFPFSEYREGQREFMASVYRTILEKEILYASAPTGIGKTIATLFSSLKAINDYRQKVFYLTAKNDGKRVVLDTIRLLEDKGLHHKTVEITAKDSMCLLKERDCDPENCPYAKGYFKKIFKAIEDVYSHESLLTKELIKSYGKKHKVCPFELSLDLSNYSDLIVCDYNYAFDPRAHLIRYFDDTTYQPILLVDEAHNMVSRSREMYSSTLTKNQFLEFFDISSGIKPSPKAEINRIIETLSLLETELLEVDFVQKDQINEVLLLQLNKLLRKLDQAFLGEQKIPNKSAVTLFYYEVVQFVKIAEFYNQEFVFLLERNDYDMMVSIKCLNASEYILQTIKEHTLSTVFFSATLEPIHFYKSLLTQSSGKDVKFPSSFPQENLCLLLVDDISTRYNDRQTSIQKVVEIAESLVLAKKGNYIIFFPSYQYLQLIKDHWRLSVEVAEVIIQRKDMSLKEREGTIEMFQTDSLRSQVGFFVMGGVFGESIDLIGDQLSGVLIIGVGLPQLSPFNNVLRSHYDETFHNGFDFAYTYPGLNKVIQAVGRVIRTQNDRGVAILIDDRFASRKYFSLYPKHWSHLQIETNPSQIKAMIELFWDDSTYTRT
ncbi:MAG: ATP-dependent DNA helicase [bacterium]|nr:ATP-dependent DNA helicase [bacterium]